MVSATDLLTIVIMRTPKKLKTDAIIMAFFGVIDLVDTQVAIALGASVHPLTNITPSIKAEVMNKAGFVSCRRNSAKEIVIIVPPKAYDYYLPNNIKIVTLKLKVSNIKSNIV